jgi:hypothetical protein
MLTSFILIPRKSKITGCKNNMAGNFSGFPEEQLGDCNN